MGRAKRWRPKRLASKLAQIRTGLGLSQTELIGALGLKGKIIREEVSQFERGLREPPLPVLLRYARLIGSPIDVIVDDKLDLPRT